MTKIHSYKPPISGSLWTLRRLRRLRATALIKYHVNSSYIGSSFGFDGRWARKGVISTVIAPLGTGPEMGTERAAVAAEVGQRLKTWFPQAKVDVRDCQVSADGFRHGQLAAIAHTTARLLAAEALPSYVVCSSHSIDVLLTPCRKSAVVDAVRTAAGDSQGSVIRIGDRGTWPGNDFDLLSDRLGLSVDEVSRDPDHCWNLSPPGLLGPQATLHYLQRLVGCDDGLLRLDVDEERRESLQH